MKTGAQLVFVVQKHAAKQLHYDFRLEIGDTMPSWAIPKGPTLDPAAKRLAMFTENHELEYRNFEGVIAAGEYGAGTVMIWDQGTYTPEVEVSKGVRRSISGYTEGQKAMREGLKNGEIKFELHGKKLKGSFALVKTHGFGPKNAWLLIKHKDRYAETGFDANDFTTSAVSKRTMEEIGKSE